MKVLMVVCTAHSNYAGTRILHVVTLRNIVINLYVKRLWPLNILSPLQSFILCTFSSNI